MLHRLARRLRGIPGCAAYVWPAGFVDRKMKASVAPPAGEEFPLRFSAGHEQVHGRMGTAASKVGAKSAAEGFSGDRSPPDHARISFEGTFNEEYPSWRE
jgi:hypothetical protein